jgi:uncharacterized phage infection (PIP) family protein YhgE
LPNFVAEEISAKSDAASQQVKALIDVDKIDAIFEILLDAEFAVVASGLTGVTSGLAEVASELTLVTPGLTEVASGLTVVASGLTVVTPGLTVVASGLTVVAPGLTGVASGLTGVASGLTGVASGFVFVCCDRLIIKTHCQQSNLRKERSLHHRQLVR